MHTCNLQLKLSIFEIVVSILFLALCDPPRGPKNGAVVHFTEENIALQFCRSGYSNVLMYFVNYCNNGVWYSSYKLGWNQVFTDCIRK